MRVKKFRCIQCGGPKVNPYSTPYIMCDFCGTFTDIDFAIGIETWEQDKEATLTYQMKKMELISRLQTALARGDRDGYYYLQREYWDLYYRSFPAYLPPTINTDETYSLYLEVCAVSSVEGGFDPKWQRYAAHQQMLQNDVRFTRTNGQTRAETESFFRLAEFFIGTTREGMRTFYENPRYSIMHRLLPEAVHFKMKTSMFVQAWIPYLAEKDAARLLQITGLSSEYEEIDRPDGNAVECPSCKTGLFAPEGSYRVFCENCRRSVAVRSRFYCMSCGVPNDIPENLGDPIECQRCGIANRLIMPYFGG